MDLSKYSDSLSFHIALDMKVLTGHGHACMKFYVAQAIVTSTSTCETGKHQPVCSRHTLGLGFALDHQTLSCLVCVEDSSS